MSLEKGIQHGKEKRKQYQGRTSKKFDRSCRNHGNCGYCENNRLFSFRKLKFKAQQQIEEWLKE
jgi:copper oxidase (laccase) domain-containing protein